MTKLYVYQIKESKSQNINSWDDVDYANDCEIIAVISGNNNQACESIANDKYDNAEIYGWSYNDDMGIADDCKYITA